MRRRRLAGMLSAALFFLAGCSKDAVDEQKGEAQRRVNAMNPVTAAMPSAPYPGQGYGAPAGPQPPGYAGQPMPQGYAQPYYAQPPGAQVPPAYPGGWPASAGGAAQGWNPALQGAPVQGPAGSAVSGMMQAPDWSRQGQQATNPWGGGWQQSVGPAWQAPQQAPRYRPLDEDERERMRRGGNPWVAPYDKPIGSSHSERPSPPTVPGLVSPEMLNPYGYGVYAPGLFGTGLPMLGFYPGVPGVLGPWGW